MLLCLLRYLRGYVSFSVSGRFPERFINIALRHNLRLWNVVMGDGSLTACMYMRDYRRIRRYARGAGVRTRVRERRGLPMLLRRYRDRMGLAVGAAAFVVSVFVMSLFIWSIDITGLNSVSESEMRSMLADNGVFIGAFKPATDAMGASRTIMLEDSRVGWMAINITGSYASVEIKEKSPSPEVEDISEPCNIKAKRDGRILSVNAEQGRTVLKEGSGVVAGQVIVSGVMDDQTGGVRLVHSKARVIAETTHKAEFRVPKSISAYVPTGEVKERRSISIFGATIPMTLGGVHTVGVLSDEISESPDPLGVTLPVELRTRRMYAIEQTRRELDDNSAKELLYREARLYEVFSLSCCTVTARDYRFISTADGFSMSVSFTCEEDVAFQDPIGVGEKTD